MFASAIVAITVVYAALFGVFRPENADDAWYGSYLHNWLHKGIARDVVYADGLDDGAFFGVRCFGKTQAFLYGPILDRAGWTKPAMHGISIVLVLASACLWRATLRRLRFTSASATTLALLMLIVEPFFCAANQARPDALVFALASLSAWFASRGWLTAAGLTAGLAMETHPMGVAALTFVAAVRFAAEDAPRNLRSCGGETVRLAMGLALASSYYFMLHADVVANLPAALAHGASSLLAGDNPLYQYFLETRYRRHLPELVAILVSLAMFWRLRPWRDHRLAVGLLVGSVMMLAVVGRPNFMYVVFYFPAFLVIMLSVVESRLRLSPAWLLAGWMVLLLPQYALAWRMNRGYDLSVHLDNLRRHVPSEATVVIGGVNDWFAFQDRTFLSVAYRGSFDRLDLKSFWVVEDGQCRTGAYPKLDALLAGCDVRECASFTDNGRSFRVLEARKRVVPTTSTTL